MPRGPIRWSRVAKRTARQRSSQPAVLQHEDAIHKYVRDADSQRLWTGVGRLVFDTLRIKDHSISKVSRSKDAAARDPSL